MNNEIYGNLSTFLGWSAGLAGIFALTTFKSFKQGYVQAQPVSDELASQTLIAQAQLDLLKQSGASTKIDKSYAARVLQSLKKSYHDLVDGNSAVLDDETASPFLLLPKIRYNLAIRSLERRLS
jgi:hypothetical protein